MVNAFPDRILPYRETVSTLAILPLTQLRKSDRHPQVPIETVGELYLARRAAYPVDERGSRLGIQQDVEVAGRFANVMAVQHDAVVPPEVEFQPLEGRYDRLDGFGLLDHAKCKRIGWSGLIFVSPWSPLSST